MMKNKQQAKRGGFTIAELLVVIVVIGILASITVVAYTGVQKRAYDSVVKDELRKISQQMSTYQLKTNEIPNSASEYVAAGIKPSRDAYSLRYISVGQPYNLLICYSSVSADDWGIIAESNGGGTYVYKNGELVDADAQLYASVNMCTNNGLPNTGRVWILNAGTWQA